MAKNAKRQAANRTATLKKKGDRGGVLPGSAATSAGLLPYGAKTGGQSSADPIGQRKKTTHTVGYNER